MQLKHIAVFAAALFPFGLLAAPVAGLEEPVGMPIEDDELTATEEMNVTAGETIKDSYVVVLKDGVSRDQFEAHQKWAQEMHQSRLHRRDDIGLTGIQQSWDLNGLYGYTGAFDNSTLHEIKQSEDVDVVEEDKVVVAYEKLKQTNAPWGLGRLSSKAGHVPSAYTFDDSAGRGVNVYVLDTGINTAHVDFGGRARWGKNVADNNDADNQGHGTHVSGTIGGSTYGVAKKANLIAVKVLGDDGSGSTSKLLSGIEWALADSQSHGNSPLKSVVNMSLGGSYSSAINRAVEAATRNGLTFVVAAGNDGVDASGYSPASSPHAITVGATKLGDARASYSNYGNFVDVFAPGDKILSTYKGGPRAVHELSGTSMASPHVAGLAAYLIAEEGLSGSDQVTARIKGLAQAGRVLNPGPGSPNEFVWNGEGQ
ncbi:secreted serine protease [Peziza echinospora]|nr:secreted serine protease [Peziza echinospora]